jgi:hypothetical protein
MRRGGAACPLLCCCLTAWGRGVAWVGEAELYRVAVFKIGGGGGLEDKFDEKPSVRSVRLGCLRTTRNSRPCNQYCQIMGFTPKTPLEVFYSQPRA